MISGTYKWRKIDFRVGKNFSNCFSLSLLIFTAKEAKVQKGPMTCPNHS